MDTTPHTLSTLFKQLGLPSSEQQIRDFVDQHSPLDPSITLAEAQFWNPGQRSFLLEALAEDSDWTALIDRLDAALRH